MKNFNYIRVIRTFDYELAESTRNNLISNGFSNVLLCTLGDTYEVRITRGTRYTLEDDLIDLKSMGYNEAIFE